MKKILLDLERLRYPNSGIAKVFAHLAFGLQNLKNNFQICVFGPSSEIKKSHLKFKMVERKPFHKFLDFFSSSNDLIHISHQLSPYFTKNYSKAIKLVTLHDLNFLHENLSEHKKQKMLKKVTKCLKYADYIVCISEFVKKDFERNKHLFQLEKLKDVFVVHNGVVFPEEKQFDLNEFTELKGKNFLLNIGVLFDKKNQLSLIKALEFTPYDLVLVTSESKGDYEEKILLEIKNRNLSNRIHIYKNISDEQKNALLFHSEALVHPSIAEGFGMPPIEAMGFGKPVFLSKFTSLPEIGGEIAFYFEDFLPESMAKTIIDGVSKYKNSNEMKQMIKSWAHNFDYKVMAENYLKLYQKILN